MQQKVTRGPTTVKISKLPMLIVLAMIFVVIGIIVALFLSFLNDNKNQKPNNHLDVVLTSSNVSSSASSGTTSSLQISSAPQSNSASSGVPAAQAEKVRVDTIVPETMPVKSDYFKDALFIGDSISKGLKVYGVVPDANVLADQNVGLDQIYNDKPVYYISAKEKTTLWKAIDAKLPNPKKIYILLGSNGVPGYENKKQMEFYSDLLDKLVKKFPDAIIYVQSVTPITKNSEYIKKTFNTKKLNDFNKQLLELVKEKGLYYLDIEKMLKDKDGFLKAEYAASDGMHMQKAGHEAVFKYFKCHIVDADGMALVPSKSE